VKIFTLLALALGLSMDCFAVAIGISFSNKDIKIKNIFLIALAFGVAHFIMPLSGWLIGESFKIYVETFDHWVAFILLFLIGGKMLFEATRKNNTKSISVNKVSVVLMLTIATSIDALLVGMSLAFLNFNLILSAAVISLTALVITFSGFIIGRRFGNFSKNKAEAIGGIILIVLGIKILAEHLANRV